MIRTLATGVIVLFASAAWAGEDAPAAKTEEVAADPEPKKAFEPPPGFKTVKRGKHVVYCRRDTAMGTRLARTTCYDEKQIRDYLLAQSQNNRDVDRARKICSSQAACGGT